MLQADTGTRAAGASLAGASFLLAGVLAFHGPLEPELGDQMKLIAEGATRWAVVHWIAAAALSLFAVAGLLVLVAGSRLTGNGWTMFAWAVIPVSALWTVTTAVAEVTVVAEAAVTGNRAMFDAWWAFAEGHGNGFSFLALAVALIAWNEAQISRGVTPVSASWTGVVAGVASFVGWALGTWLGIRGGSFLWVGSSIVMCLWTLWFGVALTRTKTGSTTT